jgi:phosphate transport system substrate-binding protein
MRNRMRRLGVAAGAVSLSLMMLSAGAAHAAPQPALSLGEAGSDTTFFMMNLISPHYQASAQNKFHDKVTQIPPLNTSPFPTSVTVPADGVHPAFTWDSSSPAATPPNGSSAGITALLNDTTGQVGFARSSRGPNPGETAKLNFWAYALGAVDYVTFPGSAAPAKGLTQAQLIGIYTCSPSTHLPIISNWSQVGGKPAGIVKYAPQAGSGTLSFFQTKLLNGATVDQNCDSSYLSTRLEEHDARGVSAVTFQNAIYQYDWARYRAQRGHFEADLTNGAVLGKYGVSTPVLPSPTNVNESKSRYNGTRYVYNVVKKTAHPAAAATQFNHVTQLIGVFGKTQGGAGYICAGRAKADITKAGFVPLSLFGSGGTGLPSSFCRLNPKPL